MNADPVYQKAIHYLSRREHSQSELTRKLSQQGFTQQEISHTIQRLIAQNLQSDERFCEAYIRYRSLRGYGPVRIKQELTERGVNHSLIANCFEMCDIDWREVAQHQYSKKFGEQAVTDFKVRAKHMRFLQYRGFTSEQIAYCFDNN